METRIAAIVPAFNEEQSISAVILDLRRHKPQIKIVVVNDCSSDRTEAVVREMGETVLSLPINLGIGGAVQVGMKYARENDFDIAVQFDGDGQHLASEIEKIVAPVVRGEADVVIGSRFLDTGTYKSAVLRRTGIEVLRWVNALLTGQYLTDTTSGFRAYNRRAIAFLARYYPQDYPEPTAIIELFRNKFRLREVSVVMKERERGRSSITALMPVYYMVKVIMASIIAFSRRAVGKEGT